MELCRIPRPTKNPGHGLVNAHAIGADRDSIVSLGSGASEHTVKHVAKDFLPRSQKWIAPTATSGRVGNDAGWRQATYAIFWGHKWRAAGRQDRLQTNGTVPASFHTEAGDGIEPLGPERPGAGHQDIALISDARATSLQAGTCCVRPKLPAPIAHGKKLLVELEVRKVETAQRDEMAHLREAVALGRGAGRATGTSPSSSRPGSAR